MKEQKLKRITESDRRRMLLAVSQNKRSRKWQEATLDSHFAPHPCGHCRAEPCGGMWPHAACCHRCTHLPMPRWRLTPVLWYRQKPYFVMESAARRPGADGAEGRLTANSGRRTDRNSDPDPDLAVSRKPSAVRPPLSAEERYGVQTSSGGAAPATDAVYYRWDGVSHWVRRARTHYFLGVRVSPAEFFRCLPNEEEKMEFAPRERPPNPFEAGISEGEEESGAPFLDQIETPPEQEVGGRMYKKGLQFVEVEDAEKEENDDAGG